MSQSRAAGSGKGKTKAAPARKKAEPALETVRVIKAPRAVAEPVLKLSATEQAISDRAAALAAEIQKACAAGDGRLVLQPAAVQALIAALCKVYSAHIEAGENYGAFSQANPVTPTDVMVTASGLLKAANLAVFELGMWQSWTGR